MASLEVTHVEVKHTEVREHRQGDGGTHRPAFMGSRELLRFPARNLRLWVYSGQAQVPGGHAVTEKGSPCPLCTVHACGGHRSHEQTAGSCSTGRGPLDRHQVGHPKTWREEAENWR